LRGDPCYKVLYDVYWECKAERQNECLALTTVVHNAIRNPGRGLERSPFLLEVMATPHVPRGIAERLPVDVTFVVGVEGSNPVAVGS
jgi:hypothetical protein